MLHLRTASYNENEGKMNSLEMIGIGVLALATLGALLASKWLLGRRRQPLRPPSQEAKKEASSPSLKEPMPSGSCGTPRRPGASPKRRNLTFEF